jgi:lipopolysaccharide transport system permease protein
MKTIIRPPRRVELDLREVWSYRDLLFLLVWRDLRVRYKQTVIGAAWALVQPIVTAAILVVVFGHLARIPSRAGEPYPIFFYPAVMIWTYFAHAVMQASQSIVDHRQIVTKTYFPRVILPIAAVVSGLVDLALSFAVLIVLMIVYGVEPRWTLVLVPAFVALAILAAFTVGLWTSALNARYRDVRHALPVVVQVWMFASPVAYGADLVPEAWRTAYALNPLCGVIEGMRWAITGIGAPPDLMVAVSSGILLLVLVGGLLYFQRTAVIAADVV